MAMSSPKNTSAYIYDSEPATPKVTSTRCKMQLEGVYGQTYGGVKAIFRCSYDPSIPEDKSFNTATPNGMAEFVIMNPAVVESNFLVIGKSYYFDITPCES